MKKIIIAPLIFITTLLIIGIIQSARFPAVSYQEVMKIGLSWPVLIIMLISCVIHLYEEPIRKFLNEFNNIETSNVKISRQSEKEESSDSIPITSVSELILHRDSQWQNTLEAEREAAATSIEQLRNESSQNITNLLLEKLKWQFWYANKSLVRNTKLVLQWIISNKIVNKELYDSTYKPIISDSVEREAIINALLELEFIIYKDGYYTPTNEGDTYIKYLINIGALN